VVYVIKCILLTQSKTLQLLFNGIGKLVFLHIPPILVIWRRTCQPEALTAEHVVGRTVWERVLLCSCVPFFIPGLSVLHGERETWCYLPYCISCLFSHTHTCSSSTEGRLQKSFSYDIKIYPVHRHITNTVGRLHSFANGVYDVVKRGVSRPWKRPEVQM
jgi:hypothetical protein